MTYELIEHPKLPGSWQVESFGEDGECFLVLFGGADSKERAEEYISWKQSK